MKPHLQERVSLFALLAAAALAANGCGGGGSAGPPPLPPQPPTITTTSLANAAVGQPYNQALQATGGTPPYAWSLAANSQPLPAALTLSSAGVISGTPTAAAAVNIAVRVTDAASQSAAGTFLLKVSDPLTITTTTLPQGNVGVPYGIFFLSASGGFGGYTWSVGAGSLPAGISLRADGMLSGTTTTTGTFNFTAQASDQSSPVQTATKALSLFIDNRLVITNAGGVTLGVVTYGFSFTYQAAGGTPPYRWSNTFGTLPPGLTLNPTTGELAGVPTTPGNYSFGLAISDSSTPAQTFQVSAGMNVNPLLTFVTVRPPDGALNLGYGTIINTGGGRPPYTLAIISGNLPPGVSVIRNDSLTGFLQLSGTPTTLGDFPFTVRAGDSSSPPTVVTRDFSIRINPQLLMNTPSLPDALEGQAYSVALAATGGVTPYTWFIRSCGGINIGCPPGLSLNSATGEYGGTPLQEFVTHIEFTVQDSSNPPQEVFRDFPFKIIGRLRLTTGSLPAVKVAQLFQVTLGRTGGTPPFSWSTTSGALPPGLALDASTGAMSGTPTATGTSNFTLQVADSGSGQFAQSVSRTLSLTIKSPGQLGRNDSITSATPLSNGTYQASISPLVDPPSSATPNPDSDYYRLTAAAGAIVTIETTADRLNPPSPLDSVIEIVDANGTRFSTCALVLDRDDLFIAPCMNDDFLVTSTDSKLRFKAPATPVTLFVHVLDFRGDARPDFVYNITIIGAN